VGRKARSKRKSGRRLLVAASQLFPLNLLRTTTALTVQAILNPARAERRLNMRTDSSLSPPPECRDRSYVAALAERTHTVRVTHGAHDDFFPFAGKSVASVRKGLVSGFSIPPEALPRIGGRVVGPAHILAGGEELLFAEEKGHKGVGTQVWTEDEFCKFFKITHEDLDAWIAQGLRVLHRPDGSRRITDTAVDRFNGVSEPHHLNTEEATWAVASIAGDLKRIADRLDPPPHDVVDTTYVAEKLGLTTKRIAQMALAGEIPSHCIVPGTGFGTYWKFFRSKIEPWIEARPRRRHLTTK
jgi:hypothetical protein